MKGWLFTGTDQPFQLGDIEPPVAGPGEAVLEVKAAGLCHSDVGTMHDPKWLALMNFLPIVMGHEVAGVVTAVGEGVTNVSVGDRVGVCPTNVGGAPGYRRHGGFTFQHVAPAVDLVRMPEGLSFEHAALGTKLRIETTVEYKRQSVTATVVEKPFFNPERKRLLAPAPQGAKPADAALSRKPEAVGGR